MNEPTRLLDKTGVPNYNNLPYDELTVLSRDTIHMRHRTSANCGPRPKYTPRRPISAFSKKSWFAFERHLGNSTEWNWFATLTFGSPVEDGRAVKQVLNRICIWLVRAGASLIWKLEYQDCGRPHFHMLLTREVPFQALRNAWEHACRVEGQVMIQPIRDRKRMITYILKQVSHPTHTIPSGHNHVGKFWGYCGPDAKPKLLLHIQGSPDQIARLRRPVAKLERRKREAKGRKPKKRSGLSGGCYRECGGASVANVLSKMSET